MENITSIVTAIVDSLTAFVTGSASAIGDGIENLLFTVSEAGAVTGVSTAGGVIFTLLGIGFGVGLMNLIIRLVRRAG